MSDLPLSPKVKEYTRCLHYRGHPSAVVHEYANALAAVDLVLGSDALEVPPEQVGRIRTRLLSEGVSESRVAELEQIIAVFLRWQAEPIRKLTDDRVQELCAAVGEGVTVPDTSDVRKLLFAPDLSTRVGLRDALALRLASHCGLDASGICSLNRDDVELKVHRDRDRVYLTVRFDDQTIRLHVFPAEPVAEVRETLPQCGALFVTRRGNRMTPRSLNERVKHYVSQLEDALSEHLSLQRLRDHAVASMLGNGADFEDVAEGLGYSRTASARRRYSRLPWHYLADRDGKWFPIETASEAESIGLARLTRAADQGMFVSRRDGRLFVRKEDVRAYFRPALSLALSETEKTGSSSDDSPLGEPVAEAFEILASALDRPEPSVDVENRPRPSGFRDAQALMQELSTLAGPRLAKILERDRGKPSAPGEIAADDTPAFWDMAEAPYDDLRSDLIQASETTQTLNAALLSIDFETPPAFAALALHSKLTGSEGPAALREVLEDRKKSLYFWALVAKYREELSNALTSASQYYELDRARFLQVGPGCLLYAFFVGIVLSNPRAVVPAGNSGPNHYDLLWECVRHWFFLLLNEAGAVEKTPQGHLLFSAPLIDIANDREFVGVFEERWKTAEQYRRNEYSFWILPQVSLLDVARYQNCVYPTTDWASAAISRAVADHVIYMGKLPVERMIFSIFQRPTDVLKSVIYWMYIPMLQAKYRDAIKRAAKRFVRKPYDVVHGVPDSEGEAIRELVYSVVDAYDFSVGTANGSGTSLTVYLEKAADRYFHGLTERLVALGEENPTEDETMERDAVESDQAPTMSTLVDEQLDGEIFLNHVDHIRGPDGEKYLVVPSDNDRAVSMLQMLPSVEGFLTVSDVFPEGNVELHDDAHLLWYTDTLLEEAAMLLRDQLS